MVKVKICGITNKKDAVWASGLGVDYLGFNFYKNSPRAVSPKNAREIIAQLPPFIGTVGVFVNEEMKVIKSIVKKTGIKVLQLHGDETVEYCGELKTMFDGIEIIKAFRIENEESLQKIPAYDVNYYLLDTYVPGVEGGTGEVFNWDLAVKAKEFGKPVFLAGGLNPGNVKEAAGKVTPYCVDTASGVERLPRRKDYDRMHDFIEGVRNAAG